ncbi:hypothetical protein [Duncaniella muris]|uniref:hypothetical protein n=2 Tax=Duncaniella muris TaxID=2094150 RepID=UPI002676967F|nr:hypothetical protein [Duncaniella muris]
MRRVIFITLFFMSQFAVYTAKAESEIIADSVKVSLLRGFPAVKITKIDIGTVHVGEKVETGCALHNQSNRKLEIEKLVVSDPGMKFATSRPWMMPEWKISLEGYLKFKTPIGKFRGTIKVYYKGVKKPTIAVIEGNVVK